MAFSLGSLLSTAASARAGARRGQREERQYQDDMELRQAEADRANKMALFNEWAQRENIRLREQDQKMDSDDRLRIAADRRDAAAAQRAAQAQALIAARIEDGWTNPTDNEQKIDAGRQVLQFNPMTGQMGSQLDPRRFVDKGADPFKRDIEVAKGSTRTFEAPVASGGAQRTIIGGRSMRYDPQEVLNRAKEKAATEFQDKVDLARIGGEERRITIQTPRPETGGGQRPTEGESKDYLFSQMLERGFADMEEMSGKIDPKKISAYFTSKFLKPTLTPEEQVYARGAREATAALLRKESGAQIKDNEVADALARYVDTGFDAPEVAAKKRAAREGMRSTYRRMGARAGGFYDKQESKTDRRHPDNPYEE